VDGNSAAGRPLVIPSGAGETPGTLLRTQSARSGVGAPPVHILTVDVEDYFQVEAFAGSISRESWGQWPCRVTQNTERVLNLFDEYGVKATFFFLGWVAERFPHLVREVHSRGHELACHSYWHRTIYSLDANEFRADTRRAVGAIEDASGVAVKGYRAPSWSITKDCLWALDILAEEGFVYDSSIFPIRHDLYGVPGAKRFPYAHACGNGLVIREFPPATLRFIGLTLPAAGGGYLRIFPRVYTALAFRMFERKYRQSVIVYCHPWEFDPEQPRIAGGLKSRFRHYTNLGGMIGNVRMLLLNHRFQRFCDALTAGENDQGLEAPMLGRISKKDIADTGLPAEGPTI
jgi:polysaccharide deacetylase family protein (PEP-CTERM system associated)